MTNLLLLPEFSPAQLDAFGPGKSTRYRPIAQAVADSLEGIATPAPAKMRGVQHEAALPDGRRLCFCTRYSASPDGFRIGSMKIRKKGDTAEGWRRFYWSARAAESLATAGERGDVSGVLVRAWSAEVGMWAWIPWQVLRGSLATVVRWEDDRVVFLGSLDGRIEFERLL